VQGSASDDRELTDYIVSILEREEGGFISGSGRYSLRVDGLPGGYRKVKVYLNQSRTRPPGLKLELL
jgi:hypothetical protein